MNQQPETHEDNNRPRQGLEGQGSKQPKDQQKPPGQAAPPQISWLTWLILFLVIVTAISFVNMQPGLKVDTWAEFASILKDDGVKPESIVLQNDRIVATLKADYQTDLVDKPEDQAMPIYVPIDSENRDFYLQKLDKMDVKWQNATGGQWWPFLLAWAPLLFLIGLILFISYRAREMTQQGPGGMMGQFAESQHREVTSEQVGVTLDDVAGAQEAKQEVQEVIGFLRDPERFRKVGARVPKGVLMQGPPGCGKTLIARAIAGEANVPFFSIAGSDFMEMIVGVGARRVRDLFKRAKDNAPAIIFLDEIDAVGRKRGRQALPGGGSGEQEQTLNAILSEMDGFEPHEQVIVIAATNRADVLDPALTRRGRFDRTVDIPLPDRTGRKEILEVHARKVKQGEDVDLDQLARSTPMFSGADLAAIINEAAIMAVMDHRDHVSMQDLRQARDKIRFGRQKTHRDRDEEQQEVTAYHEAGHTLLQAKLEDADPVEKVTIIPRGHAQGGTFSFPEKERFAYDRKYLLATMRVICGGRIAEYKQLGDMSTGAADDIKKVTQLAEKMVREWGMSEDIGFIRLTQGDEEQQWLVPQQTYSDQTATKIDAEVQRLIDEAYSEAKELIEKHWDQVDAIAQALLEHETLARDQIEALLRGEDLPKSPENNGSQTKEKDTVAT